MQQHNSGIVKLYNLEECPEILFFSRLFYRREVVYLNLFSAQGTPISLSSLDLHSPLVIQIQDWLYKNTPTQSAGRNPKESKAL